MPPLCPEAIAAEIDKMKSLRDGWDSYSAPAPSIRAIHLAREFAAEAERRGCPLSRVKASVVGGVGITRREGNLKVYVEFDNIGAIVAIFVVGETMWTMRHAPNGPNGFAPLVSQIEGFFGRVSE